jgi:hypothetical protein
VGASHLFGDSSVDQYFGIAALVRCFLPVQPGDAYGPLQKHSHSFRSKPPLLLTESQSEFDDLEARFRKEILPRGIVEQIYFDDIIASVWEILRLRR